jgi:hypothetical protein
MRAERENQQPQEEEEEEGNSLLRDHFYFPMDYFLPSHCYSFTSIFSEGKKKRVNRGFADK